MWTRILLFEDGRYVKDYVEDWGAEKVISLTGRQYRMIAADVMARVVVYGEE